MAGEISNLYGANLYGSNMNNNNLYALNNDDFLAQQYFAQQPSQPAFQGYQQPQTDTFEKSGGIGIGSGLTMGALAGLGTGAGVYFWGTNPIKDGKVDEKFIKNYNNTNLKNAKIEAFKELYTQKAQPIFNTLGIKDLDQYNAIKKLANAGKLEDLSEETRKLLPDNIKTPADAKAIVNQAKPELDKINIKKIAAQVKNGMDNTYSIDYNTTQLQKFENIKAKIDKLPKDASVADLEKFFIDNAETFKLKGTKNEIAAKAQRIAAHHGSKENLLNLYQARIDAKKQYLEDLKSGYSNIIKENWDETQKAFKKDAPEELTKAFKSFKWNKTLKFGGIATAVGLVIGLLMDNSSSK